MFPIKPMPEINNLDPRATESRPQSALQKLITFAFGKIVQLWPADSRDWALAMQAELPQMESTQQSLQWLAGGIMSLGKAWWNHMVFGWNENKKEPSAVKTPGPLAFTLAVAALVAFFMMPSVHQGFSAVMDSWHPYDTRHAADFERMAQEAEAHGDAKTLAFLSSRMSLQENVRLKDKAVELDSSLTWIYFRGGDTRYVYNHVPEKHAWIQKLEVSDPDNALPYLMEAGIRDSEIWMGSNYQDAKGKDVKDPVWLAAMAKAFAASRYDSYYDRAMDLQQSELKAHNLVQPDDVARGIVEYYSPGIGEAQTYSKLLMEQAKQAREKGDSAVAIHLAWTVLQFADKARTNLHGDVQRFFMDQTAQSASGFLQPLEAAAGHAEVAKLLAGENEGLTRKLAEKNPAFMPYVYQPLDSTSIALHSAGAGIILFGGVIFTSILFLLAARFAPSWREGRTYRWACNCARFGPAGFAAAIAVMAATFAPYLEHVHDYLAGVNNSATLHAITAMDTSINELPWRLLRAVSMGLLWEGLIPVAVLAGILFLSRKEVFRRAPRTIAA
jgi:hypothetical protein